MAVMNVVSFIVKTVKTSGYQTSLIVEIDQFSKVSILHFIQVPKLTRININKVQLAYR
jgi:hypothetical protein